MKNDASSLRDEASNSMRSIVEFETLPLPPSPSPLTPIVLGHDGPSVRQPKPSLPIRRPHERPISSRLSSDNIPEQHIARQVSSSRPPRYASHTPIRMVSRNIPRASSGRGPEGAGGRRVSGTLQHALKRELEAIDNDKARDNLARREEERSKVVGTEIEKGEGSSAGPWHGEEVDREVSREAPPGWIPSLPLPVSPSSAAELDESDRSRDITMPSSTNKIDQSLTASIASHVLPGPSDVAFIRNEESPDGQQDNLATHLALAQQLQLEQQAEERWMAYVRDQLNALFPDQGRSMNGENGGIEERSENEAESEAGTSEEVEWASKDGSVDAVAVTGGSWEEVDREPDEPNGTTTFHDDHTGSAAATFFDGLQGAPAGKPSSFEEGRAHLGQDGRSPVNAVSRVIANDLGDVDVKQELVSLKEEITRLTGVIATLADQLGKGDRCARCRSDRSVPPERHPSGPSTNAVGNTEGARIQADARELQATYHVWEHNTTLRSPRRDRMANEPEVEKTEIMKERVAVTGDKNNGSEAGDLSLVDGIIDGEAVPDLRDSDGDGDDDGNGENIKTSIILPNEMARDGLTGVHRRHLNRSRGPSESGSHSECSNLS